MAAERIVEQYRVRHWDEEFIKVDFQDGILEADEQGDPLWNGTTSEHILEKLIERQIGLQDALPCYENQVVIQHLSIALGMLHLRTARREEQGVENSYESHK